jgi:hypothetical protein
VAQFAVFVVSAIPAVGGTTVANVYRGDHPDAAAAVAEAAAILGLSKDTKVWVTPIGSLTPYRVDIATTRNVVLE